MVRVGVLSLQGDFLEHLEILKEAGAEPVKVKSAADLRGLDALVIPGGESTTIGSLIRARGLEGPIRELADSGVPIMGTCAGAILLAKKVADRVVGETGQPTLGLMDVAVIRNAFGRQKDSFVTELDFEGVGRVRAAFIRAPAIAEAWGSARIVSYVEHPQLGRLGAAALQGSMIALAFHPEITSERKIYDFFLSNIRR